MIEHNINSCKYCKGKFKKDCPFFYSERQPDFCPNVFCVDNNIMKQCKNYNYKGEINKCSAYEYFIMKLLEKDIKDESKKDDKY